MDHRSGYVFVERLGVWNAYEFHCWVCEIAIPGLSAYVKHCIIYMQAVIDV